MRPTLMIPVLAALVALSCRDGGRPVEPSISADYVQGRVQVDLADTVRYSFAHSFFERLGLDPVFIAADLPFGVLIQVDSSNFDLHISKSISDSAVTTVMKWPSEGINPQRLHVFVMFSGCPSSKLHPWQHEVMDPLRSSLFHPV